ncbi:sugar ABC transporter substrate-binding protein [Alteromonas facilis]|uniref:sugar ABC transporter substrate-binding protein n=1 Tax=Alteromonas facilis TaxID=2048004 RepID=UPI0013DD0CA3|nr:extracellular solute-binding protein [Alteromonas facilis]
MLLPHSSLALQLNERTSLNVWFASSQLDGAIQTLAKEYSQQYSAVQVNLVSIPNEDLKTSLIKTLNSGRAPDIAIFSSDNTVYAAQMRLSALPNDLVEAGLSPLEYDAMRVNGRYFGLPIQRQNRMLLLYNKAIVSSPAKSWNRIMSQADEFNAKSILPVGVLFGEGYWFGHFISLFSGQLASEGQPQLNTTAMQESLIFYKHLSEINVIRENCGYDCVSIDFYKGNVAYAINGTWALKEAVDYLGDDLGIAELPTYDGQAMKALASTVVMVFPNNSWHGSNQKAIQHFAQYLRSKEVQKQLSEMTLMLPLHDHSSYSPQARQWLDAQSALRGSTTYMPADPAFVSVWNAIRKGIRLYQSETADAKQSAEYMQVVAEKISAQVKGRE